MASPKAESATNQALKHYLPNVYSEKKLKKYLQLVYSIQLLIKP
jgi:hypothetical protein